MATSLASQLTPPATKPHVSVARVTRAWYIACLSRELKAKRPLQRTMLGIPLVLFRGEAGPGALLDRCSHRNVPLSGGKVVGACLECPYHGWQFDPEGTCKAVPGLQAELDPRRGRVPAFPVRELDGFVWVWTDLDEAPDVEPFRFPHLDDPRYTTAVRTVEAEATMHAVIENALDVPHTAFLHRGLFRGKGTTNEITAIVRRGGDRVECEYVGEPRPEGLAAKILSPSGGLVTHFDRFLLPSIAQVDYAIGEETHFLVSSVATPIGDFHTRLYAVISFRIRLPGWLVKLAIEPIGRRIFGQDARILKQQTEVIQRFGGEQFQSTELDTLGPHIWRLLKSAERGEVEREAPLETIKELVMRV